MPTKVQKPCLKAGNQVYMLNLLILVNFHAPKSGSAFSIRIRTQDSQINADPDPQYWFNRKISRHVSQVPYRTVVNEVQQT
jgi:hypothetical protein